jgi:hypothetical protein
MSGVFPSEYVIGHVKYRCFETVLFIESPYIGNVIFEIIPAETPIVALAEDVAYGSVILVYEHE